MSGAICALLHCPQCALARFFHLSKGYTLSQRLKSLLASYIESNTFLISFFPLKITIIRGQKLKLFNIAKKKKNHSSTLP